MANGKRKKGAKIGRPRTRGPTIGVALRMSKRLAERVDRMRREVAKTRTEVIEKLIAAGLIAEGRGD